VGTVGPNTVSGDGHFTIGHQTYVWIDLQLDDVSGVNFVSDGDLRRVYQAGWIGIGWTGFDFGLGPRYVLTWWQFIQFEGESHGIYAPAEGTEFYYHLPPGVSALVILYY
jgi:hypothetical protein